ncbi:unnamed protein product [Pelagomonas calceolata]|uniref:Uncharacterized protein n=2 Tax=Pelagomonas calceolata TaxID=35677 RepID=A0A8J2SME1_9STRA|nr:unnamed protein product [Pelagomonas calceolata]
MHRYGTRASKTTEGEGNMARTKPTDRRPPAARAAAAPKRARTITDTEDCAGEFDDGYGDDSSAAGDDAAAEPLEEEASDAEASDAEALDDPRALAAAKKKAEAAAKALEKRTKGCAVVVKCTMARGGNSWTLAPLDPPRTRSIPWTCVVLDEQSGVRSVRLEDLMKAADVAGDTLGLVAGATKKQLSLVRVRVVGRSADLVELDRKEGKVVWVATPATAVAAFVDETGLTSAGAVAAPTLAAALAPKPVAKTGEEKRAERKERTDWVLALSEASKDSERWAAADLPSIDPAAAFRIRELLEKDDARADVFEDLLERDVATDGFVLRPGAPLPTVDDLAALGIKGSATKKKKGVGGASHATDQMQGLATAIVKAQAQAQQQAPGGPPPFHAVAPPGYPPYGYAPPFGGAYGGYGYGPPLGYPPAHYAYAPPPPPHALPPGAGAAGTPPGAHGAAPGTPALTAATATPPPPPHAAAGAPPGGLSPYGGPHPHATPPHWTAGGYGYGAPPGYSPFAPPPGAFGGYPPQGSPWPPSPYPGAPPPYICAAPPRPPPPPTPATTTAAPAVAATDTAAGATTTPGGPPPATDGATAPAPARRTSLTGVASPTHNVAAAQPPAVGTEKPPLGAPAAGAENTAPPATPGGSGFWPAAPYSAATTPFAFPPQHYYGSSGHYAAGGALPAPAPPAAAPPPAPPTDADAAAAAEVAAADA